jgi:kumamolisin
VARVNEAIGKPLGFLNPLLYEMPDHVLHDITTGDNGAYQAGPGWDACTGLGSPNGTRLLAALRNLLP